MDPDTCLSSAACKNSIARSGYQPQLTTTEAESRVMWIILEMWVTDHTTVHELQ
jgi:hypothetical protein